MQYTTTYSSPIGGMLLAADDIGLTGLWFDGEKFYARKKKSRFFERLSAGLIAIFRGKIQALCLRCI